MGDVKRKIFPLVGTYQGKMVFAIFLPAVALHLALFGMLTFLQIDLGILVVKEASPEMIAQFIDGWSAKMMMISLCFVTVLLVVIFIVSRNMLGAFERIIYELDEVIEGRKEGPVTARRYDKLANDVLQRVNLLIEKKSG